MKCTESSWSHDECLHASQSFKGRLDRRCRDGNKRWWITRFQKADVRIQFFLLWPPYNLRVSGCETFVHVITLIRELVWRASSFRRRKRPISRTEHTGLRKKSTVIVLSPWSPRGSSKTARLKSDDDDDDDSGGWCRWWRVVDGFRVDA